MEIELFKESYTPMMMKIVKRYSDMEASTIVHIVLNGNAMQLRKITEQIEYLAEARMLLDAYPACDICFKPDCQSDHK